MAFINDDFLLSTKTARRLYSKYAEAEPIFDYHCHIPPKDIAEDRQFKNLFEIWLEGDHYKWRAMRSNGSNFTSVLQLVQAMGVRPARYCSTKGRTTRCSNCSSKLTT